MPDSSWHAQQLALVRAWAQDPSLELPHIPEPGRDAQALALARSVADRAIARSLYPAESALPELADAGSDTLSNLVEARSQILASRSIPGLRRNLTVWHRTALDDAAPNRLLDSELYLRASTEQNTAADRRLDGLIDALDDWSLFLKLAVDLASAGAPEPEALPQRPEAEPEPAPVLPSPDVQPAPVGPLPKWSSEPRYRVFSDSSDEVTTPNKLVSPTRARVLRAHLDTALRGLPSLEQTRWRNLERRIRARGRPHWVFQQPDGILDSARIARLITQPTEPLAFKQEREGPSTKATVTLLIDCSRSMGGKKMLAAALATELLSKALEAASIAVEVLGYTTRGWHGGEPRKQWEAAGRPPQPGRLCALRHVVYKAAGTPLCRARGNFGVLLEQSLLKENVDGEALWWAHRRLLQRPGRRVLVVLCDGAPECDATRRANSASYLTRHLRDVVEDIESSHKVKLVALGFDRRVTRLYPQHVLVRSADELGPALRLLAQELAA